MKKRVISAALMIIIFVPLFLMGGTIFAVFLTALSLLAMYEMIHIREHEKKFPLLVKIFAYVLLLVFAFLNRQQNVFSYTLDYHLVAFVLFAFLFPLLMSNKKEENTYNINDAFFMIASLLFISLSFNLILLVRNFDMNYLLYLLLITVMTDTFAYITGSYIGKHKIAPRISPKKTAEGLIGGLFMGTFVATVFYVTVINPMSSLVLVLFVTLFLAIVSQLGDLVFSSIKRTFKVKDYGSLLPGHGGVLDRFDSLIFVVLAFILVLGII